MADNYNIDEIFSPAEKKAKEHCTRASEHIKAAESWLIDNLQLLGIDVEKEWAKLLKVASDPDGLQASLILMAPNAKSSFVYAHLAEQGNPVLQHIKNIAWVDDNILYPLVADSTANPFVALHENQQAAVRRFLTDGEQYAKWNVADKGFKLVDKPDFTIEGDPRQAITAMAVQLLKKTLSEVTKSLPRGTMRPVQEKLQKAVQELGEAMDALTPAKSPNESRRSFRA
jgi:hypothetical protein